MLTDLLNSRQVRQLEAVVRISESIARMRLSEVASDDDVQQVVHVGKRSATLCNRSGKV